MYNIYQTCWENNLKIDEQAVKSLKCLY